MSIRKRRDGRYVIRYYSGGTKNSPQRQETLEAGSFTEATRIYLERLSMAQARRGAVDDSAVTFAMLAAEYLNKHCARKSATAKARTEQALHVILPYLGTRVARSLKPLDIEEYRQKRLAGELELNGERLRPAKPATVNREWTIIKAILNKAEAWELIERNPIRRGRVPMLKEGPGRLVFFEAEEWGRFIRAFDDEAAWLAHRTKIHNLGPVKPGVQGERRYGGGLRPDSEATKDYRERLRSSVPFFQTMLYTGSRPGEVLALSWQDVDFARGVVSLWQEKTASPKTVPMSKALREVLTSLRRGVGAAPLFTRPDGHPLTEDDVTRAFKVARRLIGLRPELTVYSLRHTFASWLAIQGTPIRTIQELLGHKDLRMTLRYAHLSPAHLSEAVEAVSAVENSVENSMRLRVGCAQGNPEAAGSAGKSNGENWWPQRESNPCSGLERAVS